MPVANPGSLPFHSMALAKFNLCFHTYKMSPTASTSEGCRGSKKFRKAWKIVNTQ
jgi:hypothetical protein